MVNLSFSGLAVDLLARIISAASPLIREKLVDLVEELKEEAKETKNDYDDLLVNLLTAALDVEDDPAGRKAGEADSPKKNPEPSLDAPGSDGDASE
jgi:hypothetical protein